MDFIFDLFTAKFIRVMKMMKPVLSTEATDLLAEEYARMRALDSVRGIDRANALPARAMESSMCLATAHAKSRASRSVDPEDAEAAIRLPMPLAAREVKAKVKNKEEKRRVMVKVDMRLTLGMMTCRREEQEMQRQSSNFLSPHWPGIAKLSVEHEFYIYNTQSFSVASQRMTCQHHFLLPSSSISAKERNCLSI